MERMEERKLRSNIKLKGGTKRRNDVKFANVDQRKSLRRTKSFGDGVLVSLSVLFM